METRLFACGLAAVSAGVAAFLLFGLLRRFVLRRRAALLQEDGSTLIQRMVRWYARNGIAFLMPVADVLLRFRHVRFASREAVCVVKERQGFAEEKALVSVFVLMAGVLALLVGLVFQSVLGALAVAACAAVGASMAASSSYERRKEQVQAMVPVAIESLSACFGAGYTLLQTFEQTSRDVKGPLAATFARAARTLELGGTAEQSLEGLANDANSSELAFLAVALDVQHQAGGSLSQVLEAVASASKGELELKRSLRVQTAQAKLSARIVAVMPLILVTAFSLVSPTFLLPFFSSPLGYALLVLAVLMQVGGIFLVRRALKVEVGG